MKKVASKGLVKAQCTNTRLNDFIRYNESMDRIQKNLNAYLEEKRVEFPRFYFISNDELLQLLAHQQEVPQVERHLNKLFDNLNKLLLAPNQHPPDLKAMISSEGEQVDFTKPVKIRAGIGVETWLKMVQEEMVVTL